ncbi:hypothetical protein D3C81_1684070 [compost metagenome]
MLQLTSLHLELLNLRLVTPLLLLALLLAGQSIVLKGITGMLMLLFEREDLRLTIGQPYAQILIRLMQPGALNQRLLQLLMVLLVRQTHLLQLRGQALSLPL